MLVKNIEVQEILVTKLDSRLNRLNLKISFNNNEPALVIEIPLDQDFEALIEKVINYVKSAKREVDTDENDVLGGISIVNIVNGEDIKDKAPKRLFMVDKKISNLKRLKTASEYMKAYSQLSTFQEIIYRK